MAERSVSKSPSDWLLAAEAAFRLLVAHLALGIVPFSRLAASLSRHREGGERTMDENEIRRIGWAVEAAASRLPMSLTCLRQAFAASWMLQARGHRPRLYYGVGKDEKGGFRAHAWVEADGHPVVGQRTAGQFRLLSVFPASSLEAG